MIFARSKFCPTTRDYNDLVPAGCIKLIGPCFAMLRPEFVKFRERSLARRESRKSRILVSLGALISGTLQVKYSKQ